MFDIDRPDQPVPAFARLVRSCEAAELRIAPLLTILLPLARTRPDAPVPADLLALARRALSASAPVAKSLDAPAPLPLHPPVTQAGLAARLALAAQRAKTFRRRHSVPEARLEAIAWQIEDRVLEMAQSGKPSGAPE
jgi:hypothetical protein